MNIINDSENEPTMKVVMENILPSIYEQNNLETKEEFSSRIQAKLTSYLTLFQKTFKEGQIFFINDDPSGKAKYIFDKVTNCINQKVDFRNQLNDDEYNTLFDMAMQVYDKNDLEQASSMFSVIIGLFPEYIQPYIMLTNILWAKEGVETAAVAYKQLIKMAVDPLLYSCAASCFINSSDPSIKEKGFLLFQQALDLINSNSEKYADYAHLIEEIHLQLAKAGSLCE